MPPHSCYLLRGGIFACVGGASERLPYCEQHRVQDRSGSPSTPHVRAWTWFHMVISQLHSVSQSVIVVVQACHCLRYRTTVARFLYFSRLCCISVSHPPTHSRTYAPLLRADRESTVSFPFTSCFCWGGGIHLHRHTHIHANDRLVSSCRGTLSPSYFSFICQLILIIESIVLSSQRTLVAGSELLVWNGRGIARKRICSPVKTLASKYFVISNV